MASSLHVVRGQASSIKCIYDCEWWRNSGESWREPQSLTQPWWCTAATVERKHKEARQEWNYVNADNLWSTLYCDIHQLTLLLFCLKCFPPMPSSKGDIDWDGQWSNTVQGNCFLLGWDGNGTYNKKSVFVSNYALYALTNAATSNCTAKNWPSQIICGCSDQLLM